MKKWTKKQKETLRKLWRHYKLAEELYYMQIDELEEIGKTNLGVDIEFFFTDGGCVGIGTYDRVYELLQQEGLEEEK